MEGEQFETKLIEMVHARTFLVNTKDRAYRDQKKKDNGWREKAEECQTTIDECLKRWKTLRDTFSRVHKAAMKPRSGSGAKVLPDWPFYSQMLWYAEFQTSRRTCANYTSQANTPEVEFEMHEDGMTFYEAEKTEEENLDSPENPDSDLTEKEATEDATTAGATMAGATAEPQQVCIEQTPKRASAKPSLKRKNPEPDPAAKVKILKAEERQAKLIEEVSTIGTAISTLVKARITAKECVCAVSPKARKIEKMVGLISVELEEVKETELSVCIRRMMEVIDEFKNHP